MEEIGSKASSSASETQPEAAPPPWRRDFPIDWPQDEYVARRDFVKFTVLVSAAFTLGQFWILAQNFLRLRQGLPPVTEVAQADALPVGRSLLFAYPTRDDPAVLVRLDETTYIAYDQRCTHLSCPVIAQPQASRFICPCHEGVYDLASGRPLAGPPRRPLRRITLDIRAGRIYATGVEASTV